MTPEHLQCGSNAGRRQNHKLCVLHVIMWPSVSVTLPDSGRVLALFPCRHTVWLYLVCCTVLLWVIMWNPRLERWPCCVCAVISDVHRTLRSHRSLPLGEMEFVCVCFRECVCVCVCVPVCVLENWLFYFSRTSHLPPPVSLSTHSLQSHEHITWLLLCYFMLCYASPVLCVVYGSQWSGVPVRYTAESSHFCQTCIMFISFAFNGASWHCLFLQTEDLFNLNLLGCHICTCHSYHIINSTVFIILIQRCG